MILALKIQRASTLRQFSAKNKARFFVASWLLLSQFIRHA
jgi:hypothetical protein